ncbi:hypothetical protein [Nesterenkonia populi]
MSSPRRPSPQVARRRRLVAAILGVLLLALVIWGVRGLMEAFSDDDAEGSPDQGQQQDEDIPAPEEGEDGAQPEGDAAQEPAEVPEGHCSPDDVLVSASTHAESYAADEAVRLIMQVRNVSGSECTIEVGTAEQTWSISRDGTEVFTTEQCDIDGESMERDFAAGETVRADLNWPRSDSSGDCGTPADLPGGEYQLTVGVSGAASQPHTFTLEGNEPE